MLSPWVYNTKTRKLGNYKAKVLDPHGMNRPAQDLWSKALTY